MVIWMVVMLRWWFCCAGDFGGAVASVLLVGLLRW